jgi:hypothetical protein
MTLMQRKEAIVVEATAPKEIEVETRYNVVFVCYNVMFARLSWFVGMNAVQDSGWCNRTGANLSLLFVT